MSSSRRVIATIQVDWAPIDLALKALEVFVSHDVRVIGFEDNVVLGTYLGEHNAMLFIGVTSDELDDAEQVFVEDIETIQVLLPVEEA